jgi:hypothetical protein
MRIRFIGRLLEQKCGKSLERAAKIYIEAIEASLSWNLCEKSTDKMLPYFSSPVPPRMSTMLVAIIICLDALQFVPDFAADAASYFAQLRGPLQINSFCMMVELKIICAPPSASSLPTKHAVASWTDHGGYNLFQSSYDVQKCFKRNSESSVGIFILTFSISVFEPELLLL